MDSDTHLCFHCGDPITSGSLFTAHIGGTERRLCCPGCQAVACLIAGSGLEAFYRRRTATGPRPLDGDSPAAATVPTIQEEYALYDRPENQGGWVEPTLPEPDTLESGPLENRRATLLVGGISCAACTWLIETALGRLPGLSGADVNLARHSLRVEWNPQKLPLSHIFAAIRQLGYRPYPGQSRPGAELAERERRAALRRLGVAGLVMMQVGMFGIALHAGDLQGMDEAYRTLLRQASLLAATLAVFYSASEFFRNAWRNLRRGRLVMDLPVATAIAIAYAASAWATLSGRGEVYFDSVAMFTFFLLLGRFLESTLRHREVLRQTDLDSLLPSSAQRRRDCGGNQLETVGIRELRPGDVVRVETGAAVPVDGVVCEGAGAVDESSFTGEAAARAVFSGEAVSAGTVLCEGELYLRATSDIANTRMAAMLAIVAGAEHSKPAALQLADRLAGWFVGAVLLLAAGTALFWLQEAPEKALWVALSVLVVSCPCALALATPAALTGAGAALRRQGVLLRDGNALERLAACDYALFDKTGTLTSGAMTIDRVETHPKAVQGESRTQYLELAAAMEAISSHPIAQAFKPWRGAVELDWARQIPGQGITAACRGREYALGHPAFIGEFCSGIGIGAEMSEASGQWLVLADRESPLAHFRLTDPLRGDAVGTVTAMEERGLRPGIASGDRSGQVAAVAGALGIQDFHAACAPEAKLRLIRELRDAGRKVLMVGDGLNDAPVLAAADASIAVNSATDLAKSRADVLLLQPRLALAVSALDKARKTRAVIIQNLAWALGYNALAVPLAAAGLVPPWAAAVGMSMSSLLVVANSLRLNR